MIVYICKILKSVRVVLHYFYLKSTNDGGSCYFSIQILNFVVLFLL